MKGYNGDVGGGYFWHLPFKCHTVCHQWFNGDHRVSTGLNHQTYRPKSPYKHSAKSPSKFPMKHIGLNHHLKKTPPFSIIFPWLLRTLAVVQLLQLACGEQRASPPRQAPPWIRNSTGRSAESVEGTYQRSSGTWRPGVPGLPSLGLARNGRWNLLNILG